MSIACPALKRARYRAISRPRIIAARDNTYFARRGFGCRRVIRIPNLDARSFVSMDSHGRTRAQRSTYGVNVYRGCTSRERARRCFTSSSKSSRFPFYSRPVLPGIAALDRDFTSSLAMYCDESSPRSRVYSPQEEERATDIKKQ